jgi:pyruvate dehydrogenase E2 component (dihydrolipoamide acetyltransferase)
MSAVVFKNMMMNHHRHHHHQNKKLMLTIMRRRSTGTKQQQQQQYSIHRRGVTGIDVNSNLPFTSSSSLLTSPSYLQSSSSSSQQWQRYYHSSNVTNKGYPMHTLLPFPALSPTMEMGTISKWELKEGDSFTAGSVICSIETDKATMDFEAQDDGIIAKILKDGPHAVDLPIGSPIAVIVEEEDDVAAFADFVLDDATTAGTAAAAAPAPAAEAPAPSSSSSSSAPVVGGETGTSILLPSARFLAESKYVVLL